MKHLCWAQARKGDDMISIIDLDAKDLEGMATAIAMLHCGSRMTWDPNPIADAAADMLPDSTSVAIRLGK